MANTYTQFYVHLVFTPKNRDALIQKSWKDEYLFEFFDDIKSWE